LCCSFILNNNRYALHTDVKIFVKRDFPFERSREKYFDIKSKLEAIVNEYFDGLSISEGSLD